MKKGKYKYVRVNARNEAILSGCPSAGPNANITGMRRLYWGEGAYIIQMGRYIYKVSRDTFYRF